LERDEWARYRRLMQGPLGIYSPNLDPLTALGIEAQTNEERIHYANLQVRMEARRVEKILAYQRAYDAAWKRTYPTLHPLESPLPTSTNMSVAQGAEGGGGRIAVFVKENCIPCEKRIKQLQAAGRAFDLYLVGSRHEDARIRTWAAQVGIDSAKVHSRTITLNHDDGRWLSIGGHGELPAVVRLIDGQWQRE
jgi:integrating conjugative element protein (TIGR03759 family)